MALLPIIVAPDPRLKVVCDPVEAIDDATRKILDDMLETMYDAPGIGLAAPQVGVQKRMIVVDVAREEDGQNSFTMVNPEIVWESEEILEYEEGCLSLPEHYAQVTRPETVRVEYLDYHGKEQEMEVSGLLSTCIQHEMDHLDGILFVDHISNLRRSLIIRKLQKFKKQQQKKAVGA